MKTFKVSFDLMCNKTTESVPYRVYIDDELMTERDYIWDNTAEYVRENCPIISERGVHELRIENLKPNDGEFHINNLTVNGKPRTLFNGKEFKI